MFGVVIARGTAKPVRWSERMNAILLRVANHDHAITAIGRS